MLIEAYTFKLKIQLITVHNLLKTIEYNIHANMSFIINSVYQSSQHLWDYNASITIGTQLMCWEHWVHQKQTLHIVPGRKVAITKHIGLNEL